MAFNRTIYNPLHRISAVFMILALLWLVISLPFVVASQQEIAKQNHQTSASIPPPATEEESSDNFGNTTEEKAPNSSGSNFSEEYLHDHNGSGQFLDCLSLNYELKNAGTYYAFHGELLVPPPNFAS